MNNSLPARAAETEQELKDLTGGQLDSVKGEDSVPLLLPDAQKNLQEVTQRQAAEMQMAILNALPAHIALLDPTGVILVVNEAWRYFASSNVLQSEDFFVGQNYIGVCEGTYGECANEAQTVAAGIRKVLRGELKDFAIPLDGLGSAFTSEGAGSHPAKMPQGNQFKTGADRRHQNQWPAFAYSHGETKCHRA